MVRLVRRASVSAARDAGACGTHDAAGRVPTISRTPRRRRPDLDPGGFQAAWDGLGRLFGREPLQTPGAGPRHLRAWTSRPERGRRVGRPGLTGGTRGAGRHDGATRVPKGPGTPGSICSVFIRVSVDNRRRSFGPVRDRDRRESSGPLGRGPDADVGRRPMRRHPPGAHRTRIATGPTRIEGARAVRPGDDSRPGSRGHPPARSAGEDTFGAKSDVHAPRRSPTASRNSFARGVGSIAT
jgi:hypothetical protein